MRNEISLATDVEKMAVETVKLQVKSFEKIYGDAFALLVPEVKNAMLLKHCMTPVIVMKWDSEELLALLAVCGDWYK